MATSELAELSRPGGPSFLDLLRSFPGQARLALGTRGVLWATLAGVIGLACCIIAFADIVVSLHRSDVDPQRQKARDVLALDNASRLLMRSLLATSAAGSRASAAAVAGEPWSNFTTSLKTLCTDFEVPPQTRLAAACTGRPEFVERVGAEIRSFTAENRPINPVVVRELLALRDDISELSLAATREADTMIGRLVDDFSSAAGADAQHHRLRLRQARPDHAGRPHVDGLHAQARAAARRGGAARAC